MMAQGHRRPTLTVVGSDEAGPDVRAPKRTDVELLAGLRRGDAAFAEDFYWRVRPVVMRTVRRLLGRLDQDGEDIAQVTMVHLIESLPRYRGECPLDAWVAAVSANVIYKHIRRRRLERTLFTSAPEGDPVPWGAGNLPAHGGAIAAREVTGRIGEHLQAMNADRAWTFLLHDVCGYSLEEIAGVCQISTAAAQSRLSRGRRELHERIAADPALVETIEGRGKP